MNLTLRPIRIVIYITTFFYAFLNFGTESSDFILQGQSATALSGVVAAAVVGSIQLLLATVALLLDTVLVRFRGANLKWVLGGLTFAYMYELALIVIYEPNPFRWAPFLVYTVICVILFLNYEENE